MNSEVTALTPGQQLSQARRAQGKSLAEIAEATRILESRLEAIERDDFGAVGTAPPFVIGYVKAFARQVDVAEKPLVKVLEAYFNQKKKADEAEQLPAVKAQPSSSRIPLLAGVAALAVFVGLGQWYFSQQTQPQVVTGPQEPTQTVPLTQRSEGLIRSALATQASQSSPVPEPAPEVSESTSGAYETTTDGSTPDAPPVHRAPSDDTPNSAETSQPTGQSIAPAASSDELVLVFSEDCWLEVFSADGSRLASRLAKAGASLSFNGQAPFDIKLGNAHAAVIAVNGRQVALEIPENRRVLRVQVGP